MFETIINLYLGNHIDATYEILSCYNIECIINCTKDVPFSSTYCNEKTSKLRIPVDDDHSKTTIINLLKILPVTVLKIDRALNNEKKSSRSLFERKAKKLDCNCGIFDMEKWHDCRRCHNVFKDKESRCFFMEGHIL